jgi:hypothetical protein
MATWTKHQLGPKELPQLCAKCGAVIIPDAKDKHGVRIADPMDPQPIFVSDDDPPSIATIIPDYEQRKPCS